MKPIALLIASLLFCPFAPARAAETPARVAFASTDGRVEISIGGQVVASYVYKDDKTLRPYFEHLKTRGGIQVTRNHPPIDGKDATDHADMHPGLWLAFGDISHNDFWRNKGPRIEHEKFAKEPAGGDGRGGFEVVNRYVAGDQLLCRETTQYTIVVRPKGYVILSDSTLTAEQDDVSLGTQEEMGFGVRVATPITVKKGNGRITNSLGGINEKRTWGKSADWCDYSGLIDNHHVGVMLINDPAAEHKPWFHSRDYGLLVANPSGPRAGAPERTPLGKGKPLRLRFALFVHETSTNESIDLAREYGELRDLFH